MEAELSIMPGSDAFQRLVLVLARDEHGNSNLVLREQSWGEGIGWYTQTDISIEPHQLNLLRSALGGASSVASAPPTHANSATDFSQSRPPHNTLRLVQ